MLGLWSINNKYIYISGELSFLIPVVVILFKYNRWFWVMDFKNGPFAGLTSHRLRLTKSFPYSSELCAYWDKIPLRSFLEFQKFQVCSMCIEVCNHQRFDTNGWSLWFSLDIIIQTFRLRREWKVSDFISQRVSNQSRSLEQSLRHVLHHLHRTIWHLYESWV